MKTMNPGVLLALLCLCGTTAFGEERTWSDRKGNTLKARYVRADGDRVVLETADGNRLTVPKAGLSEADQKYLAGVVVPDLKITVKRDSAVKRPLEATGYTQKEETYSFKITIEKTSKEDNARTFRAAMYVVGISVGDFDRISPRKVIGHAAHSFSFKESDATEFGMSCTTTVEDWTTIKHGWRYDGYIMVVRDDADREVMVQTSKSTYDRWAPHIEKFRKHETEF